MMRVSVKRSGGFAGITLARDVDSSSLAEHDKARLAELVDDARKTSLAQPRGMPDAYMYEVSIDGTEHTLGEAEMPAQWMRLIDWVLAR